MLLPPAAMKRKSAHKAEREKSAVKKLITLLLIVCVCVLCTVSALADDETELTGGFTPIGIGETPAEPAEPDGPPPTQPTTPPSEPIQPTSGGSETEPGEPQSASLDRQFSAQFSDVDAAKWYADAVDYVAEHGIMNGVGDGKFAPEAKLTRAMLVQILYNLEERPVISGTAPFDDVAGEKWYAAAVTWASANHIVEGNAGKFSPDADITREQLVTILYRYAKFKGENVNLHGSLNAFTDAGQVSSYAREGMAWAVAAGVIHGNGDGILNPSGTATRAEVAQVMKNYLTK